MYQTYPFNLCLITYFDTFTQPLLAMIQQLNAGALYKLQYRSFSIPFAKKNFCDIIIIRHINKRRGDYLQLKIFLLTALGFLSLGLGAIGLLLPVWPTTPFVLLSVACFSSAPRIKARILKIPFFREHIENYEHRTGLSRKTVCQSMIWLWGMLLLSMTIIRTFWIVILLLVVGVAVTSHILCMAKTNCRKKEKTK